MTGLQHLATVPDSPRLLREAIAHQMKVHHISQRHLADVAGVHHATVSRLLMGQQDPTFVTAVRLARGLAVLT